MQKTQCLIRLPAGGRLRLRPVADAGFEPQPRSWYSGLKRDYAPRCVPPVNFSNSNRLDQLMRAGRIHLSLQDVIALALENNLDIENARFSIPIATASGVLAGASALGATGTAATTGQGGILSGVNVQLAGAAILNLDPVVSSTEQLFHTTRPLTSSLVAGISALIASSNVPTFGIQKGFLTGTTVGLQDEQPVDRSELAVQRFQSQHRLHRRL